MEKLLSKKWWKAAGTRAIKTAAQTALGFFVAGMTFSDVDWMTAASVVGMATLASLLTSLAGLPETKEGSND